MTYKNSKIFKVQMREKVFMIKLNIIKYKKKMKFNNKLNKKKSIIKKTRQLIK